MESISDTHTAPAFEPNVGDIWRDLPPRTPFRNAIAKFREIFRATLLKQPERTMALSAIEPYKGRGKNFNYPFIKRLESRQAKPSKYEPHQGARERVRRLLANAAEWA
jgi:hypothetical protein